jgi:hypothetical protein
MPTNLVIDADGHCYEPDAGLVKWLPKEYAHLAPQSCDRQFRIFPPDDRRTLGGTPAWGGGADRGACLPTMSREAVPA